MPLLRRLLGRLPEPLTTPPSSDEPEIRSVLVIARSPVPFYHNLTDEEFCTWARGWMTSPQVLSQGDRDSIINRIRSENTSKDAD